MPHRQKRTKPSPVKTPRQNRSRATLGQLVEAARELLLTNNFEDISLRALVSRARSSTGAFYARFANRDAFLDFLDGACSEELCDGLAGFLERCGDQSAEMIRQLDPAPLLKDQIYDLAAVLIAFHRRNQGILRALALRPREVRKGRETSKRPGPGGQKKTVLLPPVREAMPRLLEHFGRFHELIRHPDPERAFALACTFLWGNVRELVLFPEILGPLVEMDDRELADEVTWATLRYLGVEG